jgi:hypothetical protein
MGLFPTQLAEGLRDRLGLERAVETGTYRGDGLRTMASLFPEAISIEISSELAESATRATSSLPNARVVLGDSSLELPRLVDAAIPTLYWLDGHWSAGTTGGQEKECPVLSELDATTPGNTSDCVLIDDARLFLAAPPPPHNPALWPTFQQIYDLLHADRPEHYITVLHDIVIAVPYEAKPLVDAFARQKVSHGRVAFGRRALSRAIRETLHR